MRLTFTVATDHIILDGLGMNFLLDTGASFNIHKEGSYGPLSLEKISEKVESELDGLAGYPFMRGLSIIIDWRKKVIDFRIDQFDIKTEKEADQRGGLITFPMILKEDKKPVQAIFDSGAKISYIHSKFIKDKRISKGMKEDFSPFFGDFLTRVYEREVIIQGKNITLLFGVLPKKLQNKLLVNNQIILGTEICKKYKVTCSMTKNSFLLEKYNVRKTTRTKNSN